MPQDPFIDVFGLVVVAEALASSIHIDTEVTREAREVAFRHHDSSIRTAVPRTL
jgi:hypothetical protein